MKKALRNCLFVTLTCLVFALTLSISVSAKKVTLSKPKITSVKKQSEKAIRIKWKKVKKAKKYEIYCSVNGKKFKKVGATKKAYFDNKVAVKEGTTYTYKIKAVNGKVKSKFSNKKKITIPKASKPKPTADPKENFNTVVNWIKTSTLIDSAGNHYILGTAEDKTMKADYTITVKNNKLYFYFVNVSGGTTVTGSMVYGIDEVTKDSVVIETTIKNTQGVDVKAHATLKPSTYTKSTKLTFTIDKNNADATPEMVQESCNSVVEGMIEGSENTMKNILGTITLKHIGFKSF